MRRLPLAGFALSLLCATSVAAQQRVGLVVGLSPTAEPTGARKARVQVQDLLADLRWDQALEQAFPIRLNYRLEVWRSREGWVDDFQRAAEWNTVIQREPLEDQYRVQRFLRSGREEYRFTTREELERWIRQINEVDVLPQGTGTFYYTVTLRITALSDDDMEELERFLAGQSAPQPGAPGGSIGRSFRRFLLRMAGLPMEDLEVQSERFVVRRARE